MKRRDPSSSPDQQRMIITCPILVIKVYYDYTYIYTCYIPKKAGGESQDIEEWVVIVENDEREVSQSVDQPWETMING
jgi:hypothetical protein